MQSIQETLTKLTKRSSKTSWLHKKWKDPNKAIATLMRIGYELVNDNEWIAPHGSYYNGLETFTIEENECLNYLMWDHGYGDIVAVRMVPRSEMKYGSSYIFYDTPTANPTNIYGAGGGGGGQGTATPMPYAQYFTQQQMQEFSLRQAQQRLERNLAAGNTLLETIRRR